ncbi:iron chaperone [Sphingomonas koreensis]
MAKTDFKSADEYIATFDGEDAAGLEAIRKTILAAVPEAEERISYQLPAFYHHGWIFYMSAHKAHFNLACPPPSAAFETFRDELAGYKMTKSAVILPKSKPLPLDLIGRMAKVQAKANAEREPKKAK